MTDTPEQQAALVEALVAKWLPDLETKSLTARATTLREAINEALAALQPRDSEAERLLRQAKGWLPLVAEHTAGSMTDILCDEIDAYFASQEGETT